MPTTWPVVSKLCLEAPVEVVGKVKGASAVASNLRPDPVPKTGLPGCQKRLPGAAVHLSTTIFLPSWFAKSNDNSITTAEHSIDRISVVDLMKTQ